jgi:predicted translation initiation factor SUI1
MKCAAGNDKNTAGEDYIRSLPLKRRKKSGNINLEPNTKKRKEKMADNGQSPKPRIYIEKRGGKKVTIISGLHTYGEARLEAMAKELKTMLGTGGTVKNGIIEIQGDKVESIKAYFNHKSQITNPKKDKA